MPVPKSRSSAFDQITTALLKRDSRHSGNDYICPAHDDDHPSLGVNQQNGKVLVHCSAGCDTKDVVAALGLKMADLFDRKNGGPTPGSATRTIAPLPSDSAIERWAEEARHDHYWTRRGVSRDVLRAYEIGWDPHARSADGRDGAYVFPYRDEDGDLVNVKKRWQPDKNHPKKDFRLLPGRPTNLLWPMDQLDRSWVVLCEGEPDALRAISNDIPAVTSITGIGGATKAARGFAPLLSDIHVLIVYDSSGKAREAAAAVADIIAPYAATVRIWDPFPQRDDDSDLSDWFDHHDDDVKKFRREIAKLPAIAPTDLEMPSRAFLFPEGAFNPPRLGMAAESTGHIRKGPGDRLYRFQGGLYLPDGEAWLGWYIRTVLKEEFRIGRRREVIAWCEANLPTIPTAPDLDYINVANGILYWQEEDRPRLEAHSPDIPSIVQLGALWDPKAKCPEIRAFLLGAIPEDCLDFMFEWIGYLLIPTSKYQRSLMLEGPRDTGKSTLLLIIEALLGAGVSHHTLQSICDERFTRADLYGRLANIYADLDARSIQNSGTFKTITTGDPISAEYKYSHPFTFRPFARQMYSANEPPGTNDQSDAYYKRWLVLPMHNQVAEEDQDPDLEHRLTAPEELSGLLIEAIAGLRRLEHRGRFLVPPTMRAALQQYRANTDTVVAWGNERLEFDRKATVRQTALYDNYRAWCEQANRHELGLQRWVEHVQSVFSRLRKSSRGGYPVFVGADLRDESVGVKMDVSAPRTRRRSGRKSG